MFPISPERLREVLNYDPLTGIFTHRIPRKRINVGEEAGTLADGYIQIQIDGVRRRGHQWAWMYMTGIWPSHRVDHKDRNRSNNVWDNLRECTQAQNIANQGKRTVNTSGYRGVSMRKDGRWRARITVNHNERWIGIFDTKEDAYEAFKKEAIEAWGEFWSE